MLFSFVWKHWIFKTLDGTANRCLAAALAEVFMAGLVGMITELKELSMEDCNREASAALLGKAGN